jgi:hypothetical protein
MAAQEGHLSLAEMCSWPQGSVLQTVPAGSPGYVVGLAVGNAAPISGASALIPIGTNLNVDVGTPSRPFRSFYSINYFANGSAGVSGSGCSAFTSGICTALGGAGGGANTSLSNLTSTSINQDLVANSVPWAAIFGQSIAANSISSNSYFTGGFPGITTVLHTIGCNITVTAGIITGQNGC